MSFVPFDAAKLWRFSGVSSFYFVFLLFSLRQPPLFATNKGKAFDICRKEQRQGQRTKYKGQGTKTRTKDKDKYKVQRTKDKEQRTKDKVQGTRDERSRFCVKTGFLRK
jgi:hypothetical protein